MDHQEARRATSADVAREAGLSRATVSYVLNEVPHRQIPERTRRRVLDAAEKLQYAPSVAARELRSGRSVLVLCLLPDWPLSPAACALLDQLTLALGVQGLTLVTHARARSARPVAEVWKAIRPAAVVSFEKFTERDLEPIRAAGIAVSVELFTPSGEGDPGAAVTEQRKGRLQAEHLIARGHHRLGYARSADGRLAGFGHPRLEGVRRVCSELGLGEPAVLTVPLDPSAAAHAVRDWRSGSPAVTGVCAFNDEVAFAVLAGAYLLALSVPRDLAVIGVDDIPTARVASPPLTTVRTEQERHADYFAEVIVRRINGRPDPPRAAADLLTVVHRQST